MTSQLALCPAPVRRALPRASETAELDAAIRKWGSFRAVPPGVFATIFCREPDERLTLTARRWPPA